MVYGETDFAALVGMAPDRRRVRLVRDAVIAFAVLVGAVGGGASIGFFLGAQQERRDTQAEITRMQEAHQAALLAISGKVSKVAETVSEAAKKQKP